MNNKGIHPFDSTTSSQHIPYTRIHPLEMSVLLFQTTRSQILLSGVITTLLTEDLFTHPTVLLIFELFTRIGLYLQPHPPSMFFFRISLFVTLFTLRKLELRLTGPFVGPLDIGTQKSPLVLTVLTIV